MLRQVTFGPMFVGIHGILGKPWRSGKVWCAILTCLFASSAMAQARDHDTLTVKTCSRCLGWTIGGAAVGIAGSYAALDQAWYAQYDRSPLHGFNDGNEWFQMDKTGHVFSSYTLGKWGHAMMSHCGANRGTARWIGGSLGLAFLTGVEFLDGTSVEWGFSGWDMAANLFGTSLFIGQDLAWSEQRIQVKLSAHFTSYAEQRPDLLGTGAAERILKDYNGMTLWLSGNIAALSGRKRVPAWLNLAFGYGAEGMTTALPQQFGADGRVGESPYRQYYLSPDIDLTRIKTKSKAVRTALFVLNSVKVPAPALEVRSTGKVVGHWLFF